MPDFLDVDIVDNYSKKSDDHLCIFNVKWPWMTTRFSKLDRCFMCRILSNPRTPRHFTLHTDMIDNMKMILAYIFGAKIVCRGAAAHSVYSGQSCEPLISRHVRFLSSKWRSDVFTTAPYIASHSAT